MLATQQNQSQPRDSAERKEIDDIKESMGALTGAVASIAERLDAIVSVDQGRMRLSREQESASDKIVHDPHDQDDDLIISHPSLTPREGMAQMWVRLFIRGEVDSGNVLRMCAPNQGWKPRSPDTLPPELSRVMSKTFEGEPIIQYRDAGLYERPMAIHQRKVAAIQHTADMQMLGVEQDLRREHVPGQPGFGAPAFTERKRTVETGRRPEPE